jgi:anti-sigma regulatory factor (Ser/Thr protein kinase)
VARAQSPSAGEGNVVVLETSPLPSNIRLIRLVTSGLVSGLGLTDEEIQDLRIAVDEACHWAVSNEVVDLLRLRFSTRADELAICLRADLRREPDPMPAATQQILDAVTGAWSLQRDGLGLELRISPRRDGTAGP